MAEQEREKAVKAEVTANEQRELAVTEKEKAEVAEENAEQQRLEAVAQAEIARQQKHVRNTKNTILK